MKYGQSPSGRYLQCAACMLVAIVCLGCTVSASQCTITFAPESPVVGEEVQFSVAGEVACSGALVYVWSCSDLTAVAPKPIPFTGDSSVLGFPGPTDSRNSSVLKFTRPGTFVVTCAVECHPLQKYSYRGGCKNCDSGSLPPVFNGWRPSSVATWSCSCVATVTVRPSPIASSGASSASGSPPLTPTPPSTGVTFGGYSLKLVDAIKCASVEQRPYTSVLIGAVGGSGWVHLPEVLIDSGADISVLPVWVANLLGVDLSNCEKRTYKGVGGGEVIGRMAEVRVGITHLGGVELDVDGYILGTQGTPFLPTVLVAFVDDDSTYILGRLDVFDLFAFVFTSDTVTIRVAE